MLQHSSGSYSWQHGFGSARFQASVRQARILRVRVERFALRSRGRDIEIFWDPCRYAYMSAYVHAMSTVYCTALSDAFLPQCEFNCTLDFILGGVSAMTADAVSTAITCCVASSLLTLQLGEKLLRMTPDLHSRLCANVFCRERIVRSEHDLKLVLVQGK